MRARKGKTEVHAPRCRTVLEPRVIMSILGHSTILLTMNTYAHVLPEVMCDAADAMDRFLDGGIDGDWLHDWLHSLIKFKRPGVS